MKLLSRYIFRTILLSILSVLLVIVSLDLLAVLIDELDQLSTTYTFFEILVHTALSAPQSLNEFMPFAALVGSLIGLGSLATSSELVVMRAAGVSVFNISRLVMKPILIVVVFAILLAEYVIPIANQVAETRRVLKLGNQQIVESTAELWHREHDEFMHFNTVQLDGVIHGVTRYQFDDNGLLQSSSFSEKAVYQNGSWLEQNVVETIFTEEGLRVKQIPVRKWNTSLYPQLLNLLVLEPDNLAIGDLYQYSRHLDRQKLDSSKYWLAFWKKLLQPLATVSLVLIAVSFIFGSLRGATVGYRILIGVVVGIVFQMAQNLLAPISLVYGFSPLIAVGLPIICCFIWGIFSLRRVK